MYCSGLTEHSTAVPQPSRSPGSRTPTGARLAAAVREPAPQLYFVLSAVFHYLGPSFAVLLFARVQVLGVAWLRIASAARHLRRSGGGRGACFARWTATAGGCWSAWGAVLAVMNACFYTAISRLPLGTVAAIEFLPVVVLAALGARSVRNLLALGARGAPASTCSPTSELAGQPLGDRVRIRQRDPVRALHRARRPRGQATAAERHRRAGGGDAHRRGRRDPDRRLAGRAGAGCSRSHCSPVSVSACPPRSSPTSPTSWRWRAYPAPPTR